MTVRGEATREVDKLIAELSRPLGGVETRAGWTEESQLGVLEHFRHVRDLLGERRPWTFARQAPSFARAFDGMPRNPLYDRIVHVEHLLEDAKREYVVSLLDRVAPTFERVGPRVFSHFGQRLVDLARLEPGARILDFGSRAGHVLIPAAQSVGDAGNVVGFDVSPQMVSRAREEVARHGLRNVEVRLADWWGDLREPEEGEELFERIFATLDYDAYLSAFGLPFLQSAWLLSSFLVYAERSRAPVALAVELRRGPEWAWYDDLLVQYGADDQIVARAIDTEPRINEFCRLWNLNVAQMATETWPVVFGSEDEWWDWVWSHDWRAQLELIPDEALSSFREDAFRHLHAMKGAVGFELPFSVLLVVAGH